jgi:hypothetical protein
MPTPATLIFHAGALGDSVLTWPILRAVPDAAFITAREKGRLAQRWLDLPGPGAGAGGGAGGDGERPDFSRLFVPAAEAEISDDVRDLLRSAHRIISYISTGQDAWAANVQQRPPRGHVIHVLEHQLQQLQAQGVHLTPAMPPRRDNFDAPVVIHPGSGSRDKCWPAERFAQLITHFHALGRPVQVIIGEVEHERGSLPPALLNELRAAGELVEHAGLVELSEFISRAALFIGNDSGPTHLAAQLGIPTLALFGPTDPRIWSPVGPAVKTLAPPQPQPMTWLHLHQLIDAAAMWSR